MIDISVSGLQKYFGDFQLFRDVSFDIQKGEKVGLLGKNGAGKTTLFSILARCACSVENEAPPAEDGDPSVYDAGTVTVRAGARIGLVQQIPVYPPERTVEEVLRGAFARLHALRRTLDELEERMAAEDGGADPALMARYGALSTQFETEGGYDTEFQLEKTARGLGITEALRSQPFVSLSGGEQTRVNLARVILERCDILLLDEPTNHLDMEAAEWLAETLSAWRGTVLVISHDRYFLDQVVERILEIEDGVCADFDGSYSYYAMEKPRRVAEALARFQEETAQKQRLEALARQYRAWATPKMMRRAREIEHRIERLTVSDRPRKPRGLRARLGEAEFWADEALSVRNLTKGFGGKPLFDNLSFVVEGGERVALYGPNGCGKTTLLRCILGELPPDAGSVRFGPQVKWTYLPQRVEFSRPERSPLETLIYERNMSPQAARDILGIYLFFGDEVHKPVSALSGGERARLKLCMLLQDQVNMLILDEPTNHLDLQAREWIEGLLEDFGGVILFVSHDRYFVSRFATRVLELKNGAFADYACGFEEYRARRLRAAEAAAAQRARERRAREAAEAEKSGAEAPGRGYTTPLKEQSRAKRRRESLRGRIAAAEAAIAELDARIEESAADYQRLSALLPEKAAQEEILLALYEEEAALEEPPGANEGA